VLSPVTVLACCRSALVSTHPLYELTLLGADGTEASAIGKAAPEREVRTYRHLLPGGRFGSPVVLGQSDGLLLLERVVGMPLWQCELDAWRLAAAELGRLHQQADVDWCATEDVGWWDRAASAEAPPDRFALPAGQARSVLAAAPRVVVHGEPYPGNVLRRADGRICLLDWESAAPGSAAIDVAALTSGWGTAEVRELRAAYDETSPAPVVDAELAAARLLWALRWVRYRHVLKPPSGSVDWAVEATAAAEELRCVS